MRPIESSSIDQSHETAHCPKSLSISTLCRSVAGGYARRNPWLDRDDLLQQAHIIALQATRTYNPQQGTPLQAYLRAAVKRGLWGYTLSQRSVVSGTGRTVAPHDHEISPDSPAVPTEVARQAIYAELHGNPIAVLVLLEGWEPRKVAVQLEIRVSAVYMAVARGRRQIRASAVCARIHSEFMRLEQLNPLYLHDETQLYLACVCAGIHRVAGRPKSWRSLVKEGLQCELPEGWRIPSGLVARLNEAQSRYESRINPTSTDLDLQARLAGIRAAKPANVLRFLAELAAALKRVQGARITERRIEYRGALDWISEGESQDVNPRNHTSIPGPQQY